MKWLITGGCGFIGSALAANLAAERGHSIRLLDNLSVGTREDLSVLGVSVAEGLAQQRDGVQLVVGDILDESLVVRCAADVDVFVHLAANTGVQPSVDDPRKDCLTNVVGTLNCLEAARRHRIKRFIFASSGAPVGECLPPIHEEVVPHPVSPYGASKLAGEGYCSAYFRTFGVETVCLRFGNVYGPGSGHKQSVVAKFIRQAIAGETLEIHGTGRQTRDFVFVGDLVRAIRMAAEVPGVGGEVFQIASNQEVTVLELLDRLTSVLKDFRIQEVRVRHGEVRKGDVMRNYSDTAKARRILGWQPEHGLEEGLKKTCAWFLRRGETRPVQLVTFPTLRR